MFSSLQRYISYLQTCCKVRIISSGWGMVRIFRKPGILEELRDPKSYWQFFGLTFDSQTIGAEGRRESCKDFFILLNVFQPGMMGLAFWTLLLQASPLPPATRSHLSLWHRSDLGVWVILAIVVILTSEWSWRPNWLPYSTVLGFSFVYSMTKLKEHRREICLWRRIFWSFDLLN